MVVIESIVEEFRKDLPVFRQAIAAFDRGELERKEYKGISGGFGSYAQSSGGHMLRLRMGGGRLTMPRLKMLAEAVEQYQVQRLKLTTCQTVQLHDLAAADVPEIMELALDSGIITRGGGGDHPRNVMVEPLAGVARDEYFNVMPYAETVGTYLIRQIKRMKMPRKLKVAFTASPVNATHATFRDLGFVGRADGTFDVYCAGGLGPAHHMGVRVATGAKPQDVLYYVRAMLDTFLENGNYENRARARTRYLQETLGIDGLQEAFSRHLAYAMEQGGLETDAKDEPVRKAPNGEAPDSPRVIAQKQTGLYAVSYHPAGGLLPSDMPRKLYDLTVGMPEVEWRIGADGTLYAINLTGHETEKVLEATASGAKTQFEASVCCIGASVCQQGLRDSQGLLAAVLAAAAPRGYADGVLPRLHISGCPSSCGTHQVGAIGFQGAAKKVDDEMLPAYFVFVDGEAARGGERFGERLGTMLERDIPAFLLELGDTVAAEDSTFAVWYPAHREAFQKLAARYL